MKNRRIISVAVTMLLFLFTCTNAYASSDRTLNAEISEMHSSTSGHNEYDKMNAFLYSDEHRQIIENTEINIISTRSESIIIELLSGEKIIQFEGKLYAVDGGGGYDGKLIAGDFNEAGAYNIVLCKIIKEKEIPCLQIMVENTETGKLEDYSFEISENEFETLMEIARDTTQKEQKNVSARKVDAEKATNAKILKLLSPSKGCMSDINLSTAMSLQNSKEYKSTISYSAVSATYAQLDSFFRSLRSGSANAGTRMNDVLRQTGFKFYKNGDYFYIMYGMDNTSTERMICMSVASLTGNSSSGGSVNAQYTIVHSYAFTYDKSTDRATVLYYDMGPRLENALIGVELVGGKTYFKNATKVYNLESGGSLKNLLYALSGKINTVGTIFDAFVTGTSSSDTVIYGDETQQKRVYGDLVRAVANKTNSGSYLGVEGTSLDIVANYDTAKTYSSHRVVYSFTAYSYI